MNVQPVVFSGSGELPAASCSMLRPRALGTGCVRRTRHILYGQQNVAKPGGRSDAGDEKIQRKIIELEKITHRQKVNGREVLWSNSADYMKVNKAHDTLRKALTACGVILAINVCLFILAGRDLKRRRRENMQEREDQRRQLNLSGEERHKIGRPFVVN